MKTFFKCCCQLKTGDQHLHQRHDYIFNLLPSCCPRCCTSRWKHHHLIVTTPIIIHRASEYHYGPAAMFGSPRKSSSAGPCNFSSKCGAGLGPGAGHAPSRGVITARSRGHVTRGADTATLTDLPGFGHSQILTSGCRVGGKL